MQTVNVFFLLYECIFGGVSLDRAAYLLGQNSIVVDGDSYKYLSSPRLPFVLVYTNNRRLHSLSVRGSLLDTRSAAVLRARLQGKWLAHPIELLPIGDNRSALSRPYEFSLSQDIAIINYGIIQQQFFYRSAAYGPVLKLHIHFPADQDRITFLNNPDNDHGLSSIYFVNFGRVALCWRPTSSARLGRLSICTRLTE